MRKKFVFGICATLVIFALASVVFRNKIENFYLDYVRSQASASKLVEIDLTRENRVNAAGNPLEAEDEVLTAQLSIDGVVKYTNEHRVKEGLPPLTINKTLNTSALVKARDMFDKQYFEHVSPDNVGPDAVIANAGYTYITVGENLALGNFQDDSVLVQGWMDSPGHRANIMHKKYTEIGVAVLKRTYEGRETWMAVQHFGLPSTACIQPDASLKEKVVGNDAEAKSLQTILGEKKVELEAFSPQSGSEYEAKVNEYNKLVDDYNKVVEENKNLIPVYNLQVEEFNKCAN